VSAAWTAVTPLPALIKRRVLGAMVGDKSIAVYYVDGAVYATGNVCTHGQALLSNGLLAGTDIECPLHAGRFDVRTGEASGPPADCALAVYDVRVTDDIVEVQA
jgi:naphthalene 1,2-dioxygenase ferredoxin component